MCTETKSFFSFPILTSRFSLNLNIIPHYVWLLLLSVSVESYISEGVRCLLLSPSDTGVQYVVWLIKQKTVGLCKNMFLPPDQQVLALLQTSMFVDIDTPATSPVDWISTVRFSYMHWSTVLQWADSFCILDFQYSADRKGTECNRNIRLTCCRIFFLCLSARCFSVAALIGVVSRHSRQLLNREGPDSASRCWKVHREPCFKLTHKCSD